MSLLSLVGEHPAMTRLRSEIVQAAAVRFPGVIHGETGAGKELVAAAIHAAADPRQRFVPVNVTTLPEQLVESELFGVGQGAYTGAGKPRPGLVEDAAGGTLLLDEAADLAPAVQAKLLRTLDTGEVRRVGTTHHRRIAFRLLISMQIPPEQLVETGRWRPDFYYRVSGVVLRVPALRERASDIPHLVNHMLAELGHAPLAPGRLAALSGLPWPGNVRQLRRVVERTLFQFSGECSIDALLRVARAMHLASPGAARPDPTRPRTRLAGAEAQQLRSVLDSTNHDTREAARVLGISRSQVYRRMEAFGIGPPPKR